MKKLLLSIALCCVLFANQTAFSQKKSNPTDCTTEEVEFKSSDLEISAGIGLFPTFNSPSAKARIIPVSAMLNYRIRQFVSVGSYIGFSSTNGYLDKKTHKQAVNSKRSLVMRHDFYVLGARLEGHFNRERVDFYGGAMLSYDISDIQKFDPTVERIDNIIIEEGRHGSFRISGYVGIKYMVTEHFGLFGEVGYGVSLMSIGLTSKV